MTALTVIALIVALAAVAALVVVLLRRPVPAPVVAPAPAPPITDELVAATVAALRQEQAATVQAAVETVVSVAGEQLSSRTAAADVTLQQHREAITHALQADRQAVGQELHEARLQLQRMSEVVDELRRERAEQQGSLERGLAEAVRTTTALAGSTEALRQALASTKARGQWGERMAVDVLQAAGFKEGVNYRKQTATAAGTIPDITFPLPGGRDLHMDVKFPFDNYLRALEAGSDAERQAYESRFLADVKQRIREITTRSYIDADTTVDHVVLFIPNESIYAFVHERDPALIDHAIGQKVVLCSPSTLFAVLAVVRHAVEQFRLERTSDEILACLASFEKEWTKWSDGFAKLGNQMITAAKTYDTLAGTRTNQLQRTLRHIERLRNERGIEGVTPLVAVSSPSAPPAAPVPAVAAPTAAAAPRGGPEPAPLPEAVGDGTAGRVGPLRLK
jgi:DNA recombination protein RmuC